MGYAVNDISYEFEPNFTKHADCQMNKRRISRDDVAAVMAYGRTCHVRGAVIYAFGHREASYCRKLGIDIKFAEGLQVICSPFDDAVITVYRNHDLPSLRRKKTTRSNFISLCR